ncbi:hypothetical protein MOK15_01705 [Sphingobium sp. BYY-5]|uniref:hypothetical protein n=1 Tax=Sphingobium sp. BYY-5 TaxID=2926400 RepID=UPI001FA77519|nr:hypothetical protein [Sphingobium sp. BYY-5]MCI4588825.1 hypothetical protein [Sphingobium sp. BYY-5]
MGWRTNLLLAACCLSSGCTIVRIEGADPQTRIVPGIVRVKPANAQSMLLVRSAGLGVVAQSQGTTLGYAAETAAYVQDSQRCTIILFQPKAADVERLVQALEAGGFNGTDLCLGGEKQ